MAQEDLFSLAIGLDAPWLVDHVTFTVEEKRLDLHINFPTGSRFACPVCGEECPVHDTREHTWRHMDFFQHEAYLHARVSRVECSEHGVLQVPVPWAREGFHFTLLFEALIMSLVREMPVLTVARMVGETDTLLWRVIDHYISKARAAVDMADVHVHAVGVDETSSRRGHDYITLFVDLLEKRLLFATPGKDAQTFTQFAEDLQAHGGSTDAITEVSMDLSSAFQKGAAEHLPKAQITFDRFHHMKLVNEAVDAVRKGEVPLPAQPQENPLALAQERRKPQSQAERKAPGPPQGPEPQNGAGLSVSPHVSGHIHGQESPPRRYPAEGLDGKRQGQRITAPGQGRLHHHESLGRRAPLIREPDHQRDSGRLQQPHPIRQGQGPQLSYPQELHQHGLPDPGQVGSQAHLK